MSFSVVLTVVVFLTLPLSQNPSLGLAVNVEGQVNIFEACRYRNVKKVVFSSSIAVYGDPAPGLIDTEPLRPIVDRWLERSDKAGE